MTKMRFVTDRTWLSKFHHCIVAYVKSCDPGQWLKSFRKNDTNLNRLLSNPLELISIDIAGLFPQSSKKSRYLLLFVGNISNGTFSRVAKDSKADTIIDFVQE